MNQRMSSDKISLTQQSGAETNTSKCDIQLSRSHLCCQFVVVFVIVVVFLFVVYFCFCCCCVCYM